MSAESRDAFADLEGLEFQLVQISDFAPLTEAAFHQKARQGLFAFVGSREVDFPEIRTRIKNVDGVEDPTRLLVDFGDDARAGTLPFVPFALTPQVHLLTHGELLREAEDPAIPAHEKRLSGLFDGRASAGYPRCLDGHAEANAVTLAKPIR